VTKISFELAGLDLLEPMAFLFNWIMMIQAWVYFRRLKKWRNSTFSISWRWFFLLFGISGLLGGISHLFFNYLGLAGKFPGWFSAVFAITFMEYAMSSTFRGQLKTFLRYFVTIKLVTTLTLLTLYATFDVVIVHMIGMGLFLAVPSLLQMAKGESDLNYFFFGFLALLTSLPFKLMAIDIHLWFNRDDVGHVFMMIASYAFYRGVKERESNELQPVKIPLS
jgi:hypothetical protein